jgi:hypothetical protein
MQRRFLWDTQNKWELCGLHIASRLPVEEQWFHPTLTLSPGTKGRSELLEVVAQ